MEFKNPILPGFHPDPSICKANDVYYLVNSSFDYFPGIPLFKSTDLVNWEQIGHVLTKETQLSLKRERTMPISQGVYAPTIRYHNGRFYVITSNMTTMQTFYVWTDNPEGEWSDITIIENFLGYDPSLYFDDDGTVYLTAAALPWPGVSEEGIIQAIIDIKTGKLIGDTKYIWDGSGYSTPEGPHLFKKDDWYYLMAAEGGTEYGHMETVARSKSPFGPFENNPNNPIVSNRSTTLPLQAVGHADMLEAKNGEWVSVLHGIRPFNSLKLHHIGRETLLAPVSWSEDGWPMIGNNGRVNSVHNLNWLVEAKENAGWTDYFNHKEAAYRWNSRGNLEKNSWYLDDGLVLWGNEFNLNNELNPPAFIGCRQKDKACEVKIDLEFYPLQEGEEAGVTVFMNEKFHYDIYRTQLKGEQVIVLRKQVGDITHIEKIERLSEPFVSIHIKSSEEKYEWSIQKESGEKIYIGEGEARLLAKEVAGGFTGIYFGMFASGNGSPAKSKATFKAFSYNPTKEN